MIFETVVRAALKDIFGGRCFFNVFPQLENGQITTRLPAARFQIVSAFNEADVCGTGTRETDDTRIQVDIVAGTSDELDPLIDDVIEALIDTELCTRDNYFTTYDEQTRTHRASIDFLFQQSSAVSS